MTQGRFRGIEREVVRLQGEAAVQMALVTQTQADYEARLQMLTMELEQALRACGAQELGLEGASPRMNGEGE